MSNVQRHGVIPCKKRTALAKGRNTRPSDYWPEVSVDSVEDVVQAKPENSLGRVLLEVFLVLGVAGMIAVAAAIWAPIMS
jgi:hypothetical protein